MLKFFILIPLFLSLLFSGCIPLFTGDGEEVKSVTPSGAVYNGLPLFTAIEMAQIERKITGFIGQKDKERKIPLRFLSVCLFDSHDKQIDCSTTDGQGRYLLVIRLPAGEYVLQAKYQEKNLRKKFNLTSLKDVAVDLLFISQ